MAGEQEFGVPPFLWEICALKARACVEAMASVSEVQKRKIMSDPRNRLATDSDLDRAMSLDVVQFGEAAYDV